jgi:uncharacterized protein YceK
VKKLLGLLAMGVLVLLGGCGTVTVKHEVQPIYITVDVNIKVQKELEDFFDFEDEEAEKKKKENL